MVNEQKRRVEDLMQRMVEEIDKSYLRKMQAAMHRCAATCCENESYNIMQVHNCVENCNSSLYETRNYVQSEFVRVQNRLQRCVLDCKDTVKDKMGNNISDNEIDAYTNEFDKCAVKCIDTYCDLLPSLEESMKKVLSSKI